MGDLYIGIMSGTSLDAVDAVLARIEDERADIIDTFSIPMPGDLHDEAVALIDADRDSLNRAFRLENRLTELYAQSALALCRKNEKLRAAAIGCHGQTLRHFPYDCDSPFTVQVVNGAMLAVRTGIPCVTDFRRADIALGGQGAPLAPGFHAACFRSTGEDRAVLNLGGIANVTFLPADPDQPVIGFDTGPANTLMDIWALQSTGARYDEDGALAARGQCHPGLLGKLLEEPFFDRPPPRSTGREHFSRSWLNARLAGFADLDACDVQATLLELTVTSVVRAMDAFCFSAKAIYACGGGCENPLLMQRLGERLAPRHLYTTARLGVDPSWVEATAFAWLAHRRVHGLTGNLPSVTGASRAAVLGALYLP